MITRLLVCAVMIKNMLFILAWTLCPYNDTLSVFAFFAVIELYVAILFISK